MRSTGEQLKRAALHTLSGGFITVAFGLLGAAAAEAKPELINDDGKVVKLAPDTASPPPAAAEVRRSATNADAREDSPAAPGHADTPEQKNARRPYEPPKADQPAPPPVKATPPPATQPFVGPVGPGKTRPNAPVPPTAKQRDHEKSPEKSLMQRIVSDAGESANHPLKVGAAAAGGVADAVTHMVKTAPRHALPGGQKVNIRNPYLEKVRAEAAASRAYTDERRSLRRQPGGMTAKDRARVNRLDQDAQKAVDNGKKAFPARPEPSKTANLIKSAAKRTPVVSPLMATGVGIYEAAVEGKPWDEAIAGAIGAIGGGIAGAVVGAPAGPPGVVGGSMAGGFFGSSVVENLYKEAKKQPTDPMISQGMIRYGIGGRR
ncbi:hypothetical protein SD37_09135 [Amycolatopsis orientalis]|uniref:Glycine zipper domain-containing protein n=1 Tax=Amycolatopsis orientalis TaxID=31958 RepID=A0A193BUE9_AMYOR|nr:hypothetical protein [Amycolatopsis orientalis]ANN15799.1 hypothetical protein SD37_09135 [Amycolatopsis orientalis]